MKAPPPLQASKFADNEVLIRNALILRPTDAVVIADLETNEIVDRFRTIAEYMDVIDRSAISYEFTQEFYALLIDNSKPDLRYGGDPYLRLWDEDIIARLFGKPFPYSVRITRENLNHLVVVSYYRSSGDRRFRGVARAGLIAGKQLLDIATEYARLRKEGYLWPDDQMRNFLQKMRERSTQGP